ncbi:Yip1 family protein [Marinoscillum furvescens]|uniref:Yip1-like protein n=1 Tax=Marinoscillum furvescens DSM 4134 TaxID=1122208 RepID=A0A3D9KZ91_MARFU|nr:Yip1 family protein [Marinoscillum furvescens]RED95226.1 Yip1-like protein [Marinoscillum furvescens DSM 4134]
MQLTELSNTQAIRHVWFSPREVFRYLKTANDNQHVIALLILTGISRAFDRAVMQDMGDRLGLTEILLVCTLGGALFGWMYIYIYGYLLRWTGKWLHATTVDIQTMVRMLAFAMLPTVASLTLLIPQIIIYGHEIFKADGDLLTGGIFNNLIFYSTVIAEVGLGIWTVILTVVGISETQELSTGKAILNMILPVLVIMVPLIAIALLISTFS